MMATLLVRFKLFKIEIVGPEDDPLILDEIYLNHVKVGNDQVGISN